MSGIGSFLGKIGSKLVSGIGKLPGLISRGASFATGMVAPAIRKVGEVAGSIARGIGSEAPSFARKIGSFAGKVASKAPGIADILEKGANIAGEIGSTIGKFGKSQVVPVEAPVENIEASEMPDIGGARKGYKVKGCGCGMR